MLEIIVVEGLLRVLPLTDNGIALNESFEYKKLLTIEAFAFDLNVEK